MMIITTALLFQRPGETLELSKANYKLKIYNALKISDGVGDLRKNALSGNATAVDSDLDPYISDYLSYNSAIYNRTANITSVPDISSEDIITVSYFLAGKVGNYTAREVRVFVWGFD
jgi:hypothetical protein